MTCPVEQEEWPDFYDIRKVLTRLGFDYRAFRALFIDDEASRNIVKAKTAQFFAFVYSNIFRDMIITVSSLMDAPGSGHTSNVTMRAAVNQARLWCDDPVIRQCNHVLDGVADPVGRIRRMRNKAIAHLDRGQLQFGKQVASVHIDDLGVVIKAMEECFNILESSVFESETIFDYGMRSFPEDVIGYVELGLILDEMRFRVQRGDFSDEEILRVVKSWDLLPKWRDLCNEHDLQLKWVR